MLCRDLWHAVKPYNMGLYFPIWRKSSYGFLSPLQICHPQLGLNLLTVGPVASTITTRPLKTTSVACTLVKTHGWIFHWSRYIGNKTGLCHLCTLNGPWDYDEVNCRSTQLPEVHTMIWNLVWEIHTCDLKRWKFSCPCAYVQCCEGIQEVLGNG
jgi:hypothetical protein